jgi:hypothetical protein
MNQARPKYTPTILQEIVGACMIVGVVLVFPLCGIFGIIGFVGRGLKKLTWRRKKKP